ncbi:MAG: tRNA epoxyqueuosine(34) reductase QueG [Prevotellaceae bacterium]|jgi:epoxyqueuosine reductase|nr:tRNA epoxyqueuosine(34) reductase QueG [Prevotellaceae bacterium]
MYGFIKKAALSVGFDACGIARAEALDEDARFLRQWLSEGKHGDMHYLARNFEKRTDPRELVPGCKSLVVTLLNYFPARQQPESAPKLAKYAYPAVDYHTVIKTKLRELGQVIVDKYGQDCLSGEHQHSFVDSAPVLERRWAERAGLGWIGKNTQLINPGFGSYCFIGVLMLNAEMEKYDKPAPNRCGSCTRCIDACPTSALANASMDARRCLSYLTIESKNEIPGEFKTGFPNLFLGCDICSDDCPWNRKKAQAHSHSELRPVGQIFEWSEEDWLALEEEEFKTLFRHSAIKRAGFQKLKQNLKFKG